jgi:iron(III) transport system ATP-binding protein
MTISLQAVSLTRPSGFRLGPLDATWSTPTRMALVGPSGSGKTTLLRLLAGLEAPQEGRIAVGGTLWTEGRRQHVAPAARGIGFVFQDGALWPHLNGRDHVRFADPRASVRDADDLLARVGLPGFGPRKPNELSGGERQRVALARALAGRPRLLLLDEPLASVDVHLREELSHLITRLADEQNLTTIVVTHDRRDAFALATHICVLQQGRVVEAGPALQLARAPRTAFAAAFLGATCIPIPATSNGHVESPFGRLLSPLPGSELVLALLPGDVGLAPAGHGPARGRVLSVHLEATGTLARVRLGEHVVAVRCEGEAPAAGDEVTLELRQPARLLRARTESAS